MKRNTFWLPSRVKHPQQSVGVIHLVERHFEHLAIEAFPEAILDEMVDLHALRRIDDLGVLVVRPVEADKTLLGREGIGESALLATHEHDCAGRYAITGGDGREAVLADQIANAHRRPQITAGRIDQNNTFDAGSGKELLELDVLVAECAGRVNTAPTHFDGHRLCVPEQQPHCQQGER